MDTLLELGFWPGCQLTWRDLKPLLERELGADPRTVKLYRQRLVQWQFLKPLHRRGILFVNKRDGKGNPVTLQAKLPTAKLDSFTEKRELKG